MSTEACAACGVAHTSGAACNEAAQQLAYVDRLFKERFSARHYLPKQVDRKTIEDIVDMANTVGSSYNLQPWKVFCIAGDIKNTISREMVHAHANGIVYEPRYDFDPLVLPAEYAARRFETGKFFYGYHGIAREDATARAAVDRRNYEFFGAPVALIFTINSELKKGAWLDLGALIQSVAIGARARGLESVAQIAIPRYDAILRKHLPIAEDELVACGMSIGYPDRELLAAGRYVRPPKRRLEEVLEVHGL